MDQYLFENHGILSEYLLATPVNSKAKAKREHVKSPNVLILHAPGPSKASFPYCPLSHMPTPPKPSYHSPQH